MNNPVINNDIYRLGLSNFYSLDGTGNNPNNSTYGAAGSNLVNVSPLDYGDRISSPAGADRTNPRVISNALAQQDELADSDRGLTNFIWAFGQFLDHDLILTPENPDLLVNIPVPQGDPFLDPDSTGRVTIPLDGTAFTEGTGTDIYNPAQISNEITAWIDGSNIYGSSHERNEYLREGSNGLLKVSAGNLLPFGDEALENANPGRQDPQSLFAAGDVRANENSVLASMHTLFVREHNRLARELASVHPDWIDDQLFERARQINIAQYQSIIYNEYLPAILGDYALPQYSGYNSDLNPNINRSFGSAAFRIGHTQLSSNILRLDTKGNEIPEGNLTLSEAFFRSSEVIQSTGIDPILRGMASSVSQNVDLKVIDDVRNLLFTFGPHTSGRDLFAINIQRGRLNGVSDYNTVRHSFGLDKVYGFDEITSNVEVQNQLAELYGNVDDIDLYVGLLAEDHLPGTALGETFQAILTQQFVSLREGDRLYYENIFNDSEIDEINHTTFADIIRRNTDTTIIQDNVFSLVNHGTTQSDRLNGGLGNDTIYGGAGDDKLKGRGGDDLLYGGTGYDQLIGGRGDDILHGGAEYDELRGGRGDDVLYGGAGNDELRGGRGDDILYGMNSSTEGWNQKDYFRGGAGKDTFVLADSDGGFYNNHRRRDRAIIEDFNKHKDTIQLHHGSRYWLGSWNGNSHLYEKVDGHWDKVAVLEDTRLDNNDLDNSKLFNYV